MAKPPPKKLDASEAGQISDARKKGWNSMLPYNTTLDPQSLMKILSKGVDPFTLVAKVRKFGQHWKGLAKR